MRSLDRWGQVKPIVANRDGTIIAGNHTYEAARRLGWIEIAVTQVDLIDQEAAGLALADNRTSDLSTYDDQLLTNMIASVAEDDDLLAATSYTDEDLAKLQGELLSGDAPITDLLGEEWGVVIRCGSEVEQVQLLERFTAEGLDVRALVA